MKYSLNFVIVATILLVGVPTLYNSAFADHAKADVTIQDGAGVPGCEETNSCFDPAEVIIDAGGEVTWANSDTAAHTVTSGDIKGEGPDGIFDSSLFGPGKTFSHTFTDAGTFKYFCMVHPWMKGIVTVQAEMMKEKEGMMKEKEEFPVPEEITREIQRNMQLSRNLNLYLAVKAIDVSHFTNPKAKNAMLDSIESINELIEKDAITSSMIKLRDEVLSKVDGGYDDIITDPKSTKLVKDNVDDFMKSLSDASTPDKQLTGKKVESSPPTGPIKPTGPTQQAPTEFWILIVAAIVFSIAIALVAACSPNRR